MASSYCNAIDHSAKKAIPRGTWLICYRSVGLAFGCLSIKLFQHGIESQNLCSGETWQAIIALR